MESLVDKQMYSTTKLVCTYFFGDVFLYRSLACARAEMKRNPTIERMRGSLLGSRKINSLTVQAIACDAVRTLKGCVVHGIARSRNYTIKVSAVVNTVTLKQVNIRNQRVNNNQAVSPIR